MKLGVEWKTEWSKRLQATNARVRAERWVHESMRVGLEWAHNNPRTFVEPAVGATEDLAPEEVEAVRYTLEKLLAKLVNAKGLLWGHGTRRPSGRRAKTLERLAAAHGARRGW